MIRISAFADEVSPSLDKQLAFLKLAGIDWVELRVVDGKNVSCLSIEETYLIHKRLEDAGVRVSAIASPIGKVSVVSPFEPQMEILEHIIRLAEVLETRLIRVFSFYPPEGEPIEKYEDEVFLRLGKMAALAAKAGVSLVHENESRIFGHSAVNCIKIVEAVNSPSLSLAYDPANFVWGESILNNVSSCWEMMRPYVVHVHIKDWKLGSEDVGSLPGDGDGQIPQLIDALAKSGYDGFVTLEPHMSSGGQFGGETTEDQFLSAYMRVREYCLNSGLVIQK